jgi:UDP-N-acetylmuramoylalanine--D-glutamate ligase
MNIPDYQHTRAVVVGLGKSGLSAARYLRAQGASVAVTDTRATPPELARLREFDSGISVRLGGFDAALLDHANLLVVSPGVPVRGAFFEAARARHLTVVGDVELFARAAQAPVAGITGTNGKSTVTTLLGRIAARAGKQVRVGGNLGEPPLDLLDQQAELYVLELSSYQLETTESLQLSAGVILNLSADHLDRYGTMDNYLAAKARLFRHCQTEVINADDALLQALPATASRRVAFSLGAESMAAYRLERLGADAWLCCEGERLLAVREMKLAGLHNVANVLATLALSDALSLPRSAALAEFREFTGLPHRMQWVTERCGVRYIDDSKGTNVGATLAAVEGLEGPLVLVAGGDAKGQDFAPLAAAFRGKVRAVQLIGRDAHAIGAALQGVCAIAYHASLPAAVRAAALAACRGDTVLLSPACASLDMFRDYAHRGAVFAAAVQELPV